MIGKAASGIQLEEGGLLTQGPAGAAMFSYAVFGGLAAEVLRVTETRWVS